MEKVFLTRKLRIWFWIYCRLGLLSAKMYRKSFLKDENKLRGKYVAKFANYVYRKRVKPNMPKMTSEERWAIILGEDNNGN